MNKKNKKFELTSTHILGILIIITFILILFLSSILDIKNEIEVDHFKENIEKIYNLVNSKDNTNINLYSSMNNIISEEYKNMNYCILLDDNGKINKIAIGTDRFYIIHDNVSDLNSILNKKIIYEDYPYTSCNNIIFENGRNCIFNNGSKPNTADEFTDGMFIYKYNYELEASSFNEDNIPSVSWKLNENLNGFGVSLVNREEEYNGNVSLCTSINDINVVSMKYLFAGYMFDSDFNNFDTRNIVDMSYMFYYYHGNNKLDLSSFDTSKVENMSYMFDNGAIKEINLKSFTFNKDVRLNSFLTNNRLLTKVLVKDKDIKKLLEKSNSQYDRLKFIYE